MCGFVDPKIEVLCLHTVKGKSVPLQARKGPEGSRKLRFPDSVTMAQDGGKVVSLTHQPPLPLGNTRGTHFCWRLIRPQCHSAIGRILSMKNSNDTSWDLVVCVCVCVSYYCPLLKYYSLFISFSTSQVCLQFWVWYVCTRKLLAAFCLLGVVGWPVVCVTH